MKMVKNDLECRLILGPEMRKLFEGLMRKTGLNSSRVFGEALAMYAYAVQGLEQGKGMNCSDGKESSRLVGYGGILGTYRSRTDNEGKK